jgi:uncharacterized repeat protein (TIGR03803 family)
MSRRSFRYSRLFRIFTIAFCFVAAAACDGSNVTPIAAKALSPSHGRVTTVPGFKVIYSFLVPKNGKYPNSRVTMIDGTLYGTTWKGGPGGGVCDCGLVYSIDKSGNQRVLHRFLGVGYPKRVYDGAEPLGGLTQFQSRLYGTTSSGGGCGSNGFGDCGTVYTIDPSGKLDILNRFDGERNGVAPIGDLVRFQGRLYGVTSAGGNPSCETPVAIAEPCFQLPPRAKKRSFAALRMTRTADIPKPV